MKCIRFVGLLLVPPLLTAGLPSYQVVYTPYEDAKPLLEALVEVLPAELREAPPQKRENLWKEWATRRDREIRGRLAQGDADSVVNLLMFGSSFTSEPRLTSRSVRSVSSKPGEEEGQELAAKWQVLFERRVQDLVHGMATPAKSERLRFARKTLERAGIEFSDEAGPGRARAYLYENAKRVLQEQAGFQQTLVEARNSNDPTEEFAERSKLYKERGLSPDTSLPPDYALEVALKEMREKGLLKPGPLKRVGIIGPGLDFTDKQEGFDFYPTQTVQPFAVVDSLVRLGLAQADTLEVDSLDLSPRVLEHMERARQAGAKGHGYAIQLPRDPAREWKPELIEYWRRFGDRIGSVAAPVAVPAELKELSVRAVRIRPDLVRRMKVMDVDIVLQRAQLAEEEAKYDLLIATNILVYYDTFEQSLAMTNIAAMLKPGGYLLTNNLLLELPASSLKAVGDVSVSYSHHQADGDQVVWYRRER